LDDLLTTTNDWSSWSEAK